MSGTRTVKEGRVNVPLGKRKQDLKKIAKDAGTTETNLARALIIAGIEKIKAGDFVFTGPSLIPAKGGQQ